jgi:hypothetical protein
VCNNYQDVAVKILIEQDFHPERVKEFMREVFINVLIVFVCKDSFSDSYLQLICI